VAEGRLRGESVTLPRHAFEKTNCNTNIESRICWEAQKKHQIKLRAGASSALWDCDHNIDESGRQVCSRAGHARGVVKPEAERKKSRTNNRLIILPMQRIRGWTCYRHHIACMHAACCSLLLAPCCASALRAPALAPPLLRQRPSHLGSFRSKMLQAHKNLVAS
jgi:hypothetical protein